MKELRYTSQFKKDLKRFLNQPKKLKALNDVLEMLRNETPLPEKYRQHALQGNYAGCRYFSGRGISFLNISRTSFNAFNFFG